jgi:hypothetical protein
MFAHFTKHLCRDEDAFLAALNLSWSNGSIEGSDSPLKLIRRSIYLRPRKHDLLRLRALPAALISAFQGHAESPRPLPPIVTMNQFYSALANRERPTIEKNHAAEK